MPLKLLILNLFLIFSCNNSTESDNSTESVVKHGCIDSQACNYDSSATIDNNSCIFTIDCSGVCGGSSVEDICGVCEGDCSTCTEGVDGMWTIYYNTSTPIGGFQFEVNGVNVMDIKKTCGDPGTAGFSLSTANNKIIGFSFSGDAIPIGSGVLVILEVTSSGDACIVEESLIISDTAGVALPASTENCNTVHIP